MVCPESLIRPTIYVCGWSDVRGALTARCHKSLHRIGGPPGLSPRGPHRANVSRMSRTRRRTAALALAPALALATLVTSSPVAAGRVGNRGHAITAGHHQALPSWQLKPVDTTEQFRGLDAVSRDVAWVGGSNGSVFRTVDGGDTWANVSPPGSTGLLFRDVEAFGRNRAVVLAIGEGDASRIYRTDDGGQTWTQTFTNPDPARLLRLHGLLRRAPRSGAQRPAGRQVPHHRDARRRSLVAGAFQRRNARRTRR